MEGLPTERVRAFSRRVSELRYARKVQLLAVGFGLLGGAVLAIKAARQGLVVSSPDQFFNAMLADHLYHGEGLTRNSIPGESYYFSEYPAARQPHIGRKFLFSFPVALVYIVTGPTVAATVIVSALFYVLLIGTAVLLAGKVRDLETALVTGTLLVVSPVMLEAGLSGLKDGMFAFLLLAALYVLFERRSPAVAGALTALAYLARSSAVVVVPVFAYYVSTRYENPRRRVGSYLTSSFVGVLPYFLRNYLVVGDPFASTQEWVLLEGIFPGPYRRLNDPPDPVGYVFDHPVALLEKFQRNLLRFTLEEFPALFQPEAVVVFAVAGVAVAAHEQDEWRTITGVFLSASALLVFVHALTFIHRRYLLFLGVCGYIAAGYAVSTLWSSADRSGQVVTVGVVCMLVVSGVAGVVAVEPTPTRETVSEEAELVDDRISDDAVVLAAYAGVFSQVSGNPTIAPTYGELDDWGGPEPEFIYWRDRLRRSGFTVENISEEYRAVERFETGGILFERLPEYEGLQTVGSVRGLPISGPQSTALGRDVLYAAGFSNNGTAVAVDVSDRSNPRVSGTVSRPGQLDSTAALDTYANGERVGTVQWGPGTFTVLDVSDGSDPAIEGSYFADAFKRPNDVVIEDGLAFVSDPGGNSVTVIETGNGSGPAIAGEVSDAERLNQSSGIAIGDGSDFAYVLNSYGRLTVVDISDPAAPDIVASTSVPSVANAHDPTVLNGTLYFTDARRGRVEVVDISDPSAPEHVTSLTGAQFRGARNIAAEPADGYLYVAGPAERGVTVLDATDPEDPYRIGSVSLDEDATGRVSLAASGGYVYASAGGAIDIVSTPTIGNSSRE